MAERQVRQSRPDQAQHRAEGPARRALLRCHRSRRRSCRSPNGAATRAIPSVRSRPARDAPQLLRRRPLRLSRHRARQQLHQHGKLGAPLLERHPDHRRGGPVAAEFVANWWLPGQREGEEEAYKQVARIRRPEIVHHAARPDVRAAQGRGRRPLRLQRLQRARHDGARPRRTSRTRSSSAASIRRSSSARSRSTPIDVARLDRGFVIANPEVLNPDCNEPYQPSGSSTCAIRPSRSRSRNCRCRCRRRTRPTATSATSAGASGRTIRRT